MTDSECNDLARFIEINCPLFASFLDDLKAMSEVRDGIEAMDWAIDCSSRDVLKPYQRQRLDWAHDRLRAIEDELRRRRQGS